MSAPRLLLVPAWRRMAMTEDNFASFTGIDWGSEQ